MEALDTINFLGTYLIKSINDKPVVIFAQRIIKSLCLKPSVV
jgi:hypothetical protein